MGGLGVLDAVVEQGGDDAVHVQLQVGDDLRHRQGVDDIGLAALAQLPLVGGVREGKGVKQPLVIQVGSVYPHLVLQGMVSFQNRVHGITSK